MLPVQMRYSRHLRSIVRSTITELCNVASNNTPFHNLHAPEREIYKIRMPNCTIRDLGDAKQADMVWEY